MYGKENLGNIGAQANPEFVKKSKNTSIFNINI